MRRKIIKPADAVGMTINCWLIVKIAGVKEDSHTLFEIECTNCKRRRNLSLHNTKQSTLCKQCFLRPEGESGMNRLLDGYRRGARVRNLEFTLSIEQFKQLTSSPCFYCSAPPSRMVKCNKRSDDKVSLWKTYTFSTWGNYTYNGIDRMNNNEGYTSENSIPCCAYCNRAKSSHTFERYSKYWKEVRERILREGNMSPGV